MTVVRLPQLLLPQAPPPGLAGAAHPSRALQGRLGSGEDAAARALRSEYDGQAAGWRAWTAGQPDYLLPLVDALDRGVRGAPRVVLEVGAGAGPATDLLVERFGVVVALDVSLEMLRLAGSGSARVQADVRRLPVRTGSVDLLVGVNAVGCWEEASRVLAPGGQLLWASSFGPETPLWTPLEVLQAAFPRCRLVTSSAGRGEWVVVLPQDAEA